MNEYYGKLKEVDQKLFLFSSSISKSSSYNTFEESRSSAALSATTLF
jgi:hypothetical protein